MLYFPSVLIRPLITGLMTVDTPSEVAEQAEALVLDTVQSGTSYVVPLSTALSPIRAEVSVGKM